MLVHLDLFSGIGGFALACQWVGIETIGFVEIDKYCQKVLRKHWPSVPIVEDIRDVEKIKEIVANATKPEGSMDRRILSTSASRQFGRSSSRGVMGCQRRGEHRSGIGKQQAEPQPTILITAGFPCQPFSVARKRQGERDDRYLWPETLTVIKAIKPKWVLLENVTGIIPLALDTVLSELEGAGYAYETLIIPACAVNARHRRDRIWIVGYYKNYGYNEDFANSSINRLEGQKPVCETRQSSQGFRYSGENWWTTEPELGRVAYGIPHRVDRLKSLGNAIVPQVAYEILKRIVELEAE